MRCAAFAIIKPCRLILLSELACSYDDVSMLPDMDEDDLDILGVTRAGHRKRFLSNCKRACVCDTETAACPDSSVEQLPRLVSSPLHHCNHLPHPCHRASHRPRAQPFTAKILRRQSMVAHHRRPRTLSFDLAQLLAASLISLRQSMATHQRSVT